MNEPPTILPPQAKGRFPLFLVGMAVIAFFLLSLTLGGLAWWWLHRTNDVAVSSVDRRSHPGETNLFNGFDLDAWEFDPAVWSVSDGVIQGEQKRSGYG